MALEEPWRPIDELSGCLWAQREALETLGYQLQVELLMVASGRTRWLARATAATQAALADLNAADARRVEVADELAAALGLEPGVSIEQLAGALPEAAEMLHLHRQHLSDLVAEVEGLVAQTRSLLARNLAATTDALSMLGITSGYGPSGAASQRTAPQSRSAMLLDASA